VTLPAGWSATTLGQCAKGIEYGLTSTSSPTGDGYRYVRITDIQNNRIDWRTVPFATADNTTASRYTIASGDILFARTGGTVGKSYLVGDVPVAATFASYLIRLRPDQRVLLPSFAAWFFRSPGYWSAILEGTGGTAQPNFNGGKLASIALSLPPISEQRRIVAKLDSLTARLARARAELERMPALGSRGRLSLLRAGTSGALTENWRASSSSLETAVDLLRRIPAPQQGRGGRDATDKIIPGAAGLSVNYPRTALPERWAWVPLLRIARQETGHTPSRSQPSYWDGGVPWIGIRDAGANHGRTINETMQTISEEGLANSSARLLPAGTVCLSRTASVGYVTKMGRPMATSEDFATWTCTPALMPDYLMYALMAEGDDIRKFGMGSTHTTIYFPEIRALHIALPPIEEQKEIVSRIAAHLARADRVGAEAAAAGALLDRLEAAILAKAFRGELVPQDPDDEPASVLLNRIRAERAAAPKRKRGRSIAPSSIEH